LFLIAGIRRGYQIQYNKKAGHGRYDIAVFPVWNNAGNRAVILEFKVFQQPLKKGNRAVIEEKLQELAREGLRQIDNQRYRLSVPVSCTELIEYGVSFYKKHCVMFARQRRRPVNSVNWEVVSSDWWFLFMILTMELFAEFVLWHNLHLAHWNLCIP